MKTWEHISRTKTHYYSGMPWCCTHLRYLALKTLTEGECCTWKGKLFKINTPEYWKERLYNSDLDLGECNCKGHVDLSIIEWSSDVKVKGVLKHPGVPPWRVLYICRAFWYITLSGKGIHFNSENKNAEGVLKSLSKINQTTWYLNKSTINNVDKSC